MNLTADQRRDVMQWDFRTWSRALPFWHQALQGRPMPQNALAVGERQGGLSLWLALNGHRVVCSDLRPVPPEARALHVRHGMADRIEYRVVDISGTDLPDASFDVAAFKSVIGALGTKEAQARAVAELHRVLRPGGILLFAENLEATRVHRVLRKRFTAWQGYWRYLRWPQDRDLFARFKNCDFRMFGLLANLGRSEAQRALLSRVDDLLMPVLPSAWRYAVAGVCHKDGPPDMNPA
ncbi:MAG: class I SAM-dependent methyltransferase [Flavobacteriales bacterium]|nr:class I SAM-dependent methyltransferase [Flavobacteriales bacterium]MEB2340644.1 class I SAM-dependent methyltransferase [Flavobacteriia bacterium]